MIEKSHITTEIVAEQEESVVTWRSVEATPLFGQSLEYAFDEVSRSLRELDMNPIQSWISVRLEPEMLKRLQEVADEQQILPVKTDPMYGVQHIEVSMLLTLRLLLYPFKGSRLWDEVIEPNFDHFQLGQILSDPEHRDIFVYDIFSPSRSEFGYQTPNTKLARRVNLLMYRYGIRDAPFRGWDLSNAIHDQIKEDIGVQNRMDAPEEWDRLFEKYWRLNDHLLITDEMREFMRDRTYVSIEVSLPSEYADGKLRERFQTDEMVNSIRDFLLGRSDGSELDQADPLLQMFLQQIVGYLDSMLTHGSRKSDFDTMKQMIGWAIDQRLCKYSFIAAIKSEYLERSLSESE